jgi:hypothetical protein
VPITPVLRCRCPGVDPVRSGGGRRHRPGGVGRYPTSSRTTPTWAWREPAHMAVPGDTCSVKTTTGSGFTQVPGVRRREPDAGRVEVGPRKGGVARGSDHWAVMADSFRSATSFGLGRALSSVRATRSLFAWGVLVTTAVPSPDGTELWRGNRESHRRLFATREHLLL